MKKKGFLFLLIMIFLFEINNNVFSEKMERKDPLLAGVLSWYMPGLGQFYAGKYLKGSIFWVVENTLFISALLTIADLNFSINKDVGFQFTIKQKEKITNTQQNISIGLFITYGVFHIYNIIDAIGTVNKYNMKNMEGHSRLSLDFINTANNNYYTLNYKF